MVTVDGAVSSMQLPSSGDVKIGRSTSCDLFIEHPSVSRAHALLKVDPLSILDVGSRNGTRVGGQKLKSGIPTPISVGEAIQLGDAVLLVQAVSIAPREPRPTLRDELEASVISVELACAQSARTGSPFAVVQIQTDAARPSDVQRDLRSELRTADAIKSDGAGGFQLVLLDTTEKLLGIAITRMTELLREREINAKFGYSRYPHDGVVPEQLIAHAYEQIERVGDTPQPMDNIREMLRTIATGNLSVLINGETGVGKELCAEMIHRLSPRAKQPFVKLNCSALVESLIESELFGHERGAFTGALTAHEGLLEAGEGGTVFLDEIGELPLGVQSKLLRALEERVVRRVGATTGKKIDVRFIGATNRDLTDEVDAGRFRRDLYYRINGVTITIPPLRDRRTEIVPLARAFAARARPGTPLALSRDVIAALEHHSWPGNIRELRNTIERAVLMSSGGMIRPSHLGIEPIATRESVPTMPLDRVSAPMIAQSDRTSSPSLSTAVADLERQHILDALEQCGGNQTRAARILGISRNTLLARLDSYGLPRPRKS
jgi:DNA-binding NtrC family response regulator/pSer/pThr/pTyr-binding forkhead associated (FHA) protein